MSKSKARTHDSDSAKQRASRFPIFAGGEEGDFVDTELDLGTGSAKKARRLRMKRLDALLRDDDVSSEELDSLD